MGTYNASKKTEILGKKIKEELQDKMEASIPYGDTSNYQQVSDELAGLTDYLVIICPEARILLTGSKLRVFR